MEEINKCLTPCDDKSIMTVLEAIECSILNYQEEDISSVNVLRSGNDCEKYHMVITTTHGKFDLAIDDMRFDKDVNA